MKHLILIVDALGKSIINESNTPRLFNYFQQGTFTGVRTLLGYSNAIIPSIFSGVYPPVHNVWGLYKLSPNSTPFSSSKFFPSWLFDRNLIIRYMANKMIFHSAIRRGLLPRYMAPANTPVKILKYFDISMKKHFTEQDCLKEIPTLFDLLRKNGQKVTYVGYPWYKGSALILDTARKFLESDANVVVAYIDEIDHAEHLYGVKSTQFARSLRIFDELCANFLSKSEEKKISITAFSDHGMRDVTGTTDIQGILRSLPLKIEKDYLMFLDSTIARIWFHNDDARQLILNALNKLRGGHVLGNDEIMKYNLNFQTDIYGHCIFLADPGKVILPNFYTIRGGTIKAMHGWSPDDHLQDSFYYSNTPLENVALTDVTKIFFALKANIGI